MKSATEYSIQEFLKDLGEGQSKIDEICRQIKAKAALISPHNKVLFFGKDGPIRESEIVLHDLCIGAIIHGSRQD